MKLSGTFTLEETTIEETWLTLSDPLVIANALPGCEYFWQIEDKNINVKEQIKYLEPNVVGQTDEPVVVPQSAICENEYYAALMEVSVGTVNPTFETVVFIDEFDPPQMKLNANGQSKNSSFKSYAKMTLIETDDAVNAEWEIEADVLGRIARRGQRVITPVVKHLTQQFISEIQIGFNNRC